MEANSLSSTEAEELRQLAEEIAREGGVVARAHRERAELAVRLKPDDSEVSEADEAAQAVMIDIIRETRPTDGIIAEETLHLSSPPPAPASERPCWVIDPIDGTRNYIRGVADYCTCVGVMLGGRPVVGAIYDPSRDIMYSAADGGRLHVNGQPRPRCDEPGFPKWASERIVVAIPSTATGAVHDLVHDFLDRFVVRNMGSTALQLALVATGQLEAAVAANSKLWDIAAAVPLINAAGGRITTPTGADLFPIDVSTYTREEIPLLAGTQAGYRRVTS